MVSELEIPLKTKKIILLPILPQELWLRKKSILLPIFPQELSGRKKNFFSLHLFLMVGAGGVVGPKGIRSRDLLFLKEKKNYLASNSSPGIIGAKRYPGARFFDSVSGGARSIREKK